MRYLISYSPQGVSGAGWHRLDVRVKGRSATVKARPGYFADWRVSRAMIFSLMPRLSKVRLPSSRADRAESAAQLLRRFCGTAFTSRSAVSIPLACRRQRPSCRAKGRVARSCLTFAADVRDHLAVESMIDETARREGGLDILVNNAGIGWFGSVEVSGPRRLAPGDRYEHHRRVQLLQGVDPSSATPWRRLDHQHQQPRRIESVRGRCVLLRVKSRTRRLQ